MPCVVSSLDISHENRKTFNEKTEYLRYSALRTAFIKGYVQCWTGFFLEMHYDTNVCAPPLLQYRYNKHAQELGNDAHKLSSDFDFAEYSVKVLADKLTEIVELSTGNWLVIWFVFGCFLIADLIDLITNSETMLLTASSIVSCYLCCGVISMFQNKAHHISHHLIHPLHLHHGHDIRGKAETLRSKFTSVCVLACVWLTETQTEQCFFSFSENKPCFNIFLFPNRTRRRRQF